jgi:hypothetical protein
MSDASDHLHAATRFICGSYGLPDMCRPYDLVVNKPLYRVRAFEGLRAITDAQVGGASPGAGSMA